MKINIIVAMDDKRGIGKDGGIPWHIPEDLKRFKELTMGHPVIMGRRTWASLPDGVRPLPGRKNIVITSSADGVFSADLENNCWRSYDLSLAIKLLGSIGHTECLVIGGGEIYKQAVGIADKLYITNVWGDYDCDTFFPDVDLAYWDRRYGKHYDQYSFFEYERPKK